MNRQNEYMKENCVKVDDYNEMEKYSTYESINDYKKTLETENKKNFAIGDKMLFDVANATLEYPVKTDKDGKKITETDENGNERYVRDTDLLPYIKLVKYGYEKKAVCNVQVKTFVYALEQLKSMLYCCDKSKAEKVADILDIVFPCENVSFGSFTESGERELKEDSFRYLLNKNLIVRTFPKMDDDGNEITKEYTWIDDKGNTHTITLCYYHSSPIDGFQIGIK